MMEQPWESDCLPYNGTVTGWLGQQREPMLSNQLLRKAPLGTARLRGLTVGPREHIYGFRQHEPWTMRHALLGWNGYMPNHGPRLPAIKQKRVTKDFKQINRSAILKAMVDAPSVRTFAVSHNATQLDPNETKDAAVKAGIRERPPPAIPPRDMAHGHTNGPKEPMCLTISHAYQTKWMIDRKLKEEREQALVDKQVVKKANKPNFRQWYPTRSSMLRTFMPETGVSSPPWRMTRFLKKAKPHLCTFPSDNVKTTHIQANAFDHVGREGSIGQGIVTKAVNQKAGAETTPLERGCRVSAPVT